MSPKTFSSKEEGYQIRNDGIYFLSWTVVRWVDVFTRPLYKDILIDSLRYCQQEKGLVLYAYVIMSNHVHLIASTPNQHLGDLIRDIKHFTSKRILKAIQEEDESRKNWMLWLFKDEGHRSAKNKSFQFWQHKNHPVLLHTERMKKDRLEYLHQNPVKAGWVYKPEDYIYSSASSYAGLDGLLEVELLRTVNW